jgi:hypothetical protein
MSTRRTNVKAPLVVTLLGLAVMGDVLSVASLLRAGGPGRHPDGTTLDGSDATSYCAEYAVPCTSAAEGAP